jgi:lantibiotic modifying enzyme
LAVLGHVDDALEILERHQEREIRGFDLYGGSAGVALSLLRFADITNDPLFVKEAEELARSLADTARHGAPAAAPDDPAPYGLLHGTTGLALLFHQLRDYTEDDRYLDLAGQALRHDLNRCVEMPDGATEIYDGTRYLVYLYGGSSGLGVILRDHLRYRELPGATEAIRGIREGCQPIYVRNSGLFRGRAGLIAALVALGEPADRVAVAEQVRYLAWDARLRDGNLVFPGFRMQRLSMDLATGTAGVLLALYSAFERATPVLPFLEARPDPDQPK